MTLRYIGPIFIFLGCFFEIFVNSIKLIERDFFIKFIQIKDSNFDDSFSTLISSVGNFFLFLFVYRIEFTHFEEHSILFIDFIFLDVIMEFFLSIGFSFFVFSEVIIRIVFHKSWPRICIFFKACHGRLS